MSRLIDADALFDQLTRFQRKLHDADRELTANQCIAFIENAPTVDAVPVVRCGECKHFIEPSWECRKLIDRDAYGEADARVYPDYFCADGERKDGEHAD